MINTYSGQNYYISDQLKSMTQDMICMINSN